MTAGRAEGWTVAAGFEPVAAAFAEELAADPRWSAQLAVRHRGRPVLDVWGGPRLAQDSLTCVFSVSKGMSGVVMAMLTQQGLLDLDRPVATYWPEFAAGGKAEVTVRQVLTHQAGLPEVDGGLTWDELVAHTPAAVRLAAQRPFWRPGTAWGYHALTLGVLMAELCRRVTGTSLQEYFDRQVRAPREIDAHLGLPEALEHRVSPLCLPPVPDPPPSTGQLAELVGRRLMTPAAVLHLANARESHAVGQPAAGGQASARGLADLYAHTIGPVDGHQRLLAPETVGAFGQIHSTGRDVILDLPGCFGVVFQKPYPGRPFAGHDAFGHDGAGGALAFADPGLELGFGYVTDWPRVADDRTPDRFAALTRQCVLAGPA